MAKRRGPSISLKMIISSTLLILVIVGLFGFLGIQNIKNIYDDQAQQQQKIFEQSTREHGSSQIDTLAEGILTPLKGNEFESIHPMLIRAKQHDVLVRNIWLIDQQGRRVSSSDDADNKAFQQQWDTNADKIKPFGHMLLPQKFLQSVTAGGKRGAPVAPKPPMPAMEAPPPMDGEPMAELKAMKPAEGEEAANDMEGDGTMSPAMASKMAPGMAPSMAPMAAAAKKTPRRVAMQTSVRSLIRDYKGERVMVVGKPIIALGTYLGSVFVVYSLQRLKEQMTRIQRLKERKFAEAWQRSALIGGLFVAIGLLMAIFQGLRISKPIRLLATRATQIAQGELLTRVEVTTNDELGLLAENFNFMADQLVILLRESEQQGAVQKELEVARNIQERLVPTSDIVDRPFLRLSGYFEPASECGGDWWTYHDLEDGKVLVVIADVTGHGVPSAMITATAKSAVDTLRAVTNNNLTVTYLLEILNRAILESAKRKFVMTCFASIIDPVNHTITFANAGHNFPYIYREEGGRGKFNVLMTRGNRLGDMEDSTYQAKVEDLAPGDTIVWYTDGIVECESEIGEEYGEKRFRNSIRKLAGREPDEVRDGVVSAAVSFFGKMLHKDDITMVIGKYYEPGTAPALKTKPEGAAGGEGAAGTPAGAPPTAESATDADEAQKETEA
ncbi:MAG: SpoIIE family protein phosphatase [bacterium]